MKLVLTNMSGTLDPMTLCLIIGLLLIFTIFYVKYQRKNFLGNSFLLIVISYLQGLLISLVFFQFEFYNLFLYAVVLGCLYYILIPKIFYMVILILLQRGTPQDEKITKFDNQRIMDFLVTKTKIPLKQFEIGWIGKDLENASRQFSFTKVKIFLGGGFKKLNEDELLFIICHEVGHTQSDKKQILRFSAFGICFFIGCVIVSVILPILNLLNLHSFFVVSIVLFLLGIISFNYLFWNIEFEADIFAIGLIKKIDGAESFFNKYNDSQKDYTTIPNLLFYDHPPIDQRIKKIKERIEKI